MISRKKAMLMGPKGKRRRSDQREDFEDEDFDAGMDDLDTLERCWFHRLSRAHAVTAPGLRLCLAYHLNMLVTRDPTTGVFNWYALAIAPIVSR